MPAAAGAARAMPRNRSAAAGAARPAQQPGEPPPPDPPPASPKASAGHHRRPRHRQLPLAAGQTGQRLQRRLCPRSRRRRHRHHASAAAEAGPRLRPLRRLRLFQVGDERIRLQLRLRAAGALAAPADHGRPRHQHPDQAQGLRATPRQVVKRLEGSCSPRPACRWRPGRTSRGRCWRPSRIEKGILNVLLFLIIARGRLRHPGHLLHDRGRRRRATSASSRPWAPPTAA